MFKIAGSYEVFPVLPEGHDGDEFDWKIKEHAKNRMGRLVEGVSQAISGTFIENEAFLTATFFRLFAAPAWAWLVTPDLCRNSHFPLLGIPGSHTSTVRPSACL